MSATTPATTATAKIGPFDAAAIKRANPLDRVARDYGLRSRRCGRDRLVAFCPFHDDRRTPNLVLDLRDPDDEHFHCFAGHCRAHGDVIAFVMRMERLDFPSACARLAGATPPAGGRPPSPAQVA
jgi:DNA primase